MRVMTKNTTTSSGPAPESPGFAWSHAGVGTRSNTRIWDTPQMEMTSYAAATGQMRLDRRHYVSLSTHLGSWMVAYLPPDCGNWEARMGIAPAYLVGDGCMLRSGQTVLRSCQIAGVGVGLESGRLARHGTGAVLAGCRVRARRGVIRSISVVGLLVAVVKALLEVVGVGTRRRIRIGRGRG